MTFTRLVFAFALFMLLVGIFGSRLLVHALFSAPPEPRLVAAAGTATPTSTPTLTPLPVRIVPSHTLPGAHRRLIGRHGVSRHVTSRAATPTVTPTPLPTPSPTPGVLTLARYWVGSLHALPGQTIAIGYVIDNGTGRTERIMLGASLKSDRILNWATQALSDPPHDVVAIVPPGITTHTRYFTLPRGLRPGSYDLAWGLRDAVTGVRDALVAAPAVLQVGR